MEKWDGRKLPDPWKAEARIFGDAPVVFATLCAVKSLSIHISVARGPKTELGEEDGKDWRQPPGTEVYCQPRPSSVAWTSVDGGDDPS